MTPEQWNFCNNPDEMLVAIDGVATDRQLRLWCCACVRRVWHRFARAVAGRRAVEVAEAFALDAANASDSEKANRDAEEAIVRARAGRLRDGLRAAAWCTAGVIDALGVARSVAWAATYAAVGKNDVAKAAVERAAQSALLRDIFGNPFRHIALDSDWRTPTVILLAQSAYNERLMPGGCLDNTRLAVLADALEEAGCTEHSIIDHLRGPGPHVPGCWPVDLALVNE